MAQSCTIFKGGNFLLRLSRRRKVLIRAITACLEGIDQSAFSEPPSPVNTSFSFSLATVKTVILLTIAFITVPIPNLFIAEELFRLSVICIDMRQRKQALNVVNKTVFFRFFISSFMSKFTVLFIFCMFLWRFVPIEERVITGCCVIIRVLLGLFHYIPPENNNTQESTTAKSRQICLCDFNNYRCYLRGIKQKPIKELNF